jgi:hypothetical protein
MFEALGKSLGIDIKPVQDVPAWLPETPDQLRAITGRPTMPQPLWDVAGGGLDDHQLNLTNQRIMKTTKLMRARMQHIRDGFDQLNMPMTFATYLIGYWLAGPKRDAERDLLYRHQKAQGSGRNWATPNNRYPIDFDYLIATARARNHIHSATMWNALKAQAPTPDGALVYGYVLPLTPQEVAVSQQAAKEKFVEQQLRGRTVTYALYPHLATTQTPGLSVTYLKLVEYTEKQYQKAVAATRVASADPKAAQQAATEWGTFLNTISAKWGRQGASTLYAKDQEAQKAARATQGPSWMEKHEAQKAAWIASHPEVKGELAHAQTLIQPHQRWTQWFQGQPFTKQGADGTRLDYLIAVEAGQPVQAQIACNTARAKKVEEARRTGRTTKLPTNPC